jgi:hypothetical protein
MYMPVQGYLNLYACISKLIRASVYVFAAAPYPETLLLPRARREVTIQLVKSRSGLVPGLTAELPEHARKPSRRPIFIKMSYRAIEMTAPHLLRVRFSF